MRKVGVIGIVALFIGIASCSESSAVGEDFIESSNFNLEFTSSIPLEFSTVRFDSLITSQSQRLLVGGSQGTPLGDFNTESFFQISLEQDFLNEDQRYDSITLTLQMDGYTLYLDDESVRKSIKVDRLAGELAYRENEFALYNYSDIAGATDVPGDLLAEKEFFWASDRIRNLEIRLSDVFGQDLFDRLMDEDEIFADPEKASEYLRGFKVYFDDPDFMVGFLRDSIKLTIHTTDLDSSPLENESFDFYIGSTPGYTKYIHQNLPENLETEDLDEEIVSDSLDGYAYISAGLGYATKINLTGVKELIERGDEFILAEAEIRLRWFKQSHEQYPNTLFGILVDGNNLDLAEGQQFNFDLIFNEENSRDNYYILNATSVVEFILEQPIGRDYYLLLTIDEFESSANSVVLADQSLASEINIFTIKN